MNLVKEFNERFIELVEIVAEASAGAIKVHRHYSGRFMYGQTCIGLDMSPEVSEIEVGAKMMQKACTVNHDPTSFQIDLLDVLELSQSESLGTGMIVYFPTVRDPRPELSETTI